jgi:hypothetical protein
MDSNKIYITINVKKNCGNISVEIDNKIHITKINSINIYYLIQDNKYLNKKNRYVCYFKIYPSYMMDNIFIDNFHIYDKSLFPIFNDTDIYINTNYDYKIHMTILNFNFNIEGLFKYVMCNTSDEKNIYDGYKIIYYLKKIATTYVESIKYNNSFKSINIITSSGHKGTIICNYVRSKNYEYYFFRKICIYDTEIILFNDKDKCSMCNNNIIDDIDIESKYRFICKHIKNNIFNRFKNIKTDIFLVDNYYYCYTLLKNKR